MLFFFQAAGTVQLNITGASFSSVQFDPANTRSCRFDVMNHTQMVISGTDGALCLWSLEIELDPSADSGEMTASADTRSEMEFQDLPFSQGGKVHVSPGETKTVIKWIAQGAFSTIAQ